MASMNAGIILSGQQPDFVNILDRSNQAAQTQIGNQRQNALAATIQREGPGALAGNQQSLNALARFDPAAAQGLQAGQQSMRINEEQLRLSYENAKLAGQKYAASVSAGEAAARAEKIDRALAMATQAQSPEQWDQIMTQAGAAEYVGKFAEKDIIIAGALGISEALKMGKGPEYRPATQEEAARYGSVGGQINDRTGQFTPINPPSGMNLTTNPDGSVSLQQGPGVTGGRKPLTEAQSKSVTYATRAEGALKVLEPVADALTDRTAQIAQSAPYGLGSPVQSDDFQVARNAGDEFLQAILRKDTGAAITEQEQELYGKTYLPQPGDRPAVLQAKKEARARAIEALKAGMSIEEVALTDQALVRSAERIAPTQIDGFTIEAVE